MIDSMFSQCDSSFVKPPSLLLAGLDVNNEESSFHTPLIQPSPGSSSSIIQTHLLDQNTLSPGGLNPDLRHDSGDLEEFYGALFATTESPIAADIIPNVGNYNSNDGEPDALFIAALTTLRDSIGRDRRLNNDYRIERLLGFGSFGVVVDAKDLVHDNNGKHRVAIKIMASQTIPHHRYVYDPVTHQSSPLEIYLMKTAPAHPNLIHYIDSWTDGEFWYLVTELAGHCWSAGSNSDTESANKQSDNRISFWPHMNISFSDSNNHSLAGFLKLYGGFASNVHSLNGKRERPPVLPEPIQRILFRQIVNAVSALHSNNIVHRDLKDENFLVDRNLRVHLIDFGHAGRCYQDRFHFAPTRFSSYGTHLFGPPEWRSGRMLAGPQADVYAIGLILYEMSFGDLPPNLEKARAEQNNCVFDISARTGFHSPILRQLLYGMLSPDPNKRLTIEKVQQHPWLTEEV